ncbi:hypothetical protein D1AOALGA4SA_4561 [Olavius algarvensis Delta 1 endosymbiont]|nr:hypothetical protein D1AOALGA4SA_4561 [Olavius algarvensis Delta 1 endosymbiont]
MVSLRSVYQIAIDHLPKKLSPTFIFVNACIPWVYRKSVKMFCAFCAKLNC